MARDFNGSSQYASYAAAIASLGTTYSVHAWARPDGTSTNGVMSNYRNNGGTAIAFQLDQNNSDCRFLVRGDGGTIATATKAASLTAGNWHSCVGTRDGNNLSVYVNNSTAGTASAAFGAYTPNYYRVGAVANSAVPSGYFDGKLAEIAVWSVVIDAAEIVALYAGYSPALIRPGSLVGYWPIIGRASPEVSPRGKYDLTLTASPANFDHPRITVAAPQLRLHVPAAAAATTVGRIVGRVPAGAGITGRGIVA